ncbi:MAG: hypothetical protein M1840_003258 [Geoglossum simile]|nr:MAG: hypothetical protein M1840_003258 [Geoglossum simile]
MDGVLEVKPYTCPPWVPKPNVIICDSKEHASAIIEDYKPGQIDIYVDASVRNGKAGIGIYAMPSKMSTSKLVVSFTQADAHFIELLAINEAANWPWDPTSTRSKSKKPPQRDGHPWYLVMQTLKDAGITVRRLLSGRSNVGSFTKKIDAALHLGKSAELYQQLTSSEAAILTQL